jgi:hypothetical protein
MISSDGLMNTWELGALDKRLDLDKDWKKGLLWPTTKLFHL